MLPCPNCGSEETNGTFCTPCLKKLHPLIRKIKPAKLTCCVESERIQLHGVWKPIEKAITEALVPALIPTGEISDIKIEIPELEWKPGIQKTAHSQAIVTGKNEDAQTTYEETYDIPIDYLMTVSEEYKKKGTTYFEGVIQIRNETETVQKEVYKYIDEHQTDIMKAVEVPTGTDYFLTDHRAVNHLAQQLHKHHGGVLKLNAQHFSHDKQRSKPLYRTTAFVQLPEYSRGDVIFHNNTYLLITKINVRITGQNLVTGTKKTFDYRPEEAVVLPIEETRIVKTNPVEVLHPKTFAPTTPENTLKVELDQTIQVAIHDDKVILMPQESQ